MTECTRPVSTALVLVQDATRCGPSSSCQDDGETRSGTLDGSDSEIDISIRPQNARDDSGI